MEFEERKKLAEEHANKFAPLPRIDPVSGGLAGAFGALAILAVFFGLADLSADGFVWPVVITILLSFALPFIYLKRRRNRHYQTYAEQLVIREKKGPKKEAAEKSAPA